MNGDTYGTYSLRSAVRIGLPNRDRKTSQFTLTRGDDTMRKKASVLGKRMQPFGTPLVSVKKAKPPPPPPPPISAIGIMDVGQGACAMLIDHNRDPVTYYDVGYPLLFHRSSAPTTLRPGQLGPILQNYGNSLEIVLSHWDWDHWRLGAIWNLQALPWTYPFQFIGWTANNFLLTIPLPNRNVYNPLVPVVIGPNYTICQCVAPPNAPPSVLINNSGLALLVPIRLPHTDIVAHEMLMTGDANFDTLPNYPHGYANLTGIAAAHHGSIAHNVTANLPAQVPAYANQGRIVYSYGITTAGTHCYGFPVAAAVTAYQTAGWGSAANTFMSTAEAAHLNAPGPPALRGNIRVGDPTALRPIAAYTGTAFATFATAVD